MMVEKNTSIGVIYDVIPEQGDELDANKVLLMFDVIGGILLVCLVILTLIFMFV